MLGIGCRGVKRAPESCDWRLLAVTAVGAAVVYQSAARERDYRQLLAHGDAALAGGQTLCRHRGLQRRHRPAARLDARPPPARRNLPAARRPGRRRPRLPRRRRRSTPPPPGRSRSGATPSTSSSATGGDRGLRSAPAPRRSVGGDSIQASASPTIATAIWTRRWPRLRAGRSAWTTSWPTPTTSLGVCLREKDQTRPRPPSALENAVQRSPGSDSRTRGARGLVRRRSDGAATRSSSCRCLPGSMESRLERRVAVGLAHARAGHADLAVLTLGSALERAPDQPLVYGALGRVWLEIAETRQDRPDAIGKALEALERAASSPTATSEVKTLYGRALLRRPSTRCRRAGASAGHGTLPGRSGGVRGARRRRRTAEALRRRARTALISYNALVGDDANFAARALKIGLLSLRLERSGDRSRVAHTRVERRLPTT